LALRRGLTRCAPATYARARARAELRARCAPDGAGDRFDRILAELRHELHVDEATVAKLGALEQELERRLTRPVPATARLVDRARRDGTPVAFVSDMYQPAAFLRDLLADHGLIREGDLLLVSS